MTTTSTGGFTQQQIRCINSMPWDGFFAEIKKQGKHHPYMPPHILNRLLNAVFGPDGWDGPILVTPQQWKQWPAMKNHKGEPKTWLTSEATVEIQLKYRNADGHLTGGFRRIQASSGHMLAVESEYNVPQMVGHLLQGAVTKAMRAACKEIGILFGSAVLKERKDVQGRPVQWRSLCVSSFDAVPWPSLPGIDSDAHAEQEFVAQANDFTADDFDGADEDAPVDRQPQHVEPQSWSAPAPARDTTPMQRPPQPQRAEPQRAEPQPEPTQDKPVRWFVEYTNGDEHGKFTTNIEAVKASLEAKGYQYTARPARPGDREYRRPRQDQGAHQGQQGDAPSAPQQTGLEALREAAVAAIQRDPQGMVPLFQEVTGKKTAAVGTLDEAALTAFLDAAKQRVQVPG